TVDASCCARACDVASNAPATRLTDQRRRLESNDERFMSTSRFLSQTLSAAARDERVRQRFKKGNQITSLVGGESHVLASKRLVRHVEATSSTAAAIIEIDHLVERSKRAIVHVRWSDANIAQRRRTEGVSVEELIIDRAASEIGIDDAAVGALRHANHLG